MKIALKQSPVPRVSIISPSFTRTDMLHSCLRSLEMHMPEGVSYETIVVLNEVKESVAAELRENVTGVKYARSPINLGVAGAGNRGRSLACGEFLLLLHDDTEVLPGFLQPLLETAAANPQAGAVGSMVLFPDGKLQNVGSILWQNGVTARPWLGDVPDAADFSLPVAVDYCGTCSVLVRMSAWDEIGGLDEEYYPAYYVDVDLCTFLRNNRYTVLCEPRSQVHHHRGASSSLRFQEFLKVRNRKRFVQKWAAFLEQQEPQVINSLDAIERAKARAIPSAKRSQEKQSENCTRTDASEFDVVRQEREHFARALDLLRNQNEELCSTIDEIEDEVRNLRTSFKSLQESIAKTAQ